MPDQKFNVGSMIADLLKLLVFQTPKYLSVAFLLFAPVTILFIYSFFPFLERAFASNEAEPVLTSGFLWTLLGIVILSFISISLYMGFLVKHSYGQFTDGPVTVFAALKSSVTAVPIMLAIYLISLISLFVGLILLIVPGLYIITIWSCAPAVVIVERLGPIAALKRSAALTHGYRWQVFGTVILSYIIITIIGMVFSIGLGSIFGTFDFFALLSGESEDVALIWLVLVDVPANYLSYSFGPLISTLLYIALRREKEGGVEDELADVFD